MTYADRSSVQGLRDSSGLLARWNDRDPFGEAAILARLAAERQTAYPILVLPPSVQWRLVDVTHEHWAAEVILKRPEFGTKVKLTVAPRANLQTRIEWLSTDPELSPGDYLLEMLRIAQHPRAGWGPVHLLGNRPSLVPQILELGLSPLLPAVARHTRDLGEHVALLDALADCGEQAIRERSLELFDGRTDVPWPLRLRAMRDLALADSQRPSGIAEDVSTSWNAIVFAEANEPHVEMEHVTTAVSRTRRGGSQVLSWPGPLPRSIRRAAESTARRRIATEYAAQLSTSMEDVSEIPLGLSSVIAHHDLSTALTGEQPQPASARPSMRPAPTKHEPKRHAPPPPQPQDIVADTRTWRARPDGEVVELQH